MMSASKTEEVVSIVSSQMTNSPARGIRAGTKFSALSQFPFVPRLKINSFGRPTIIFPLPEMIAGLLIEEYSPGF
jgi:hypothetical protein